MSDAFTARATTKDLVYAAIGKLSLPRSANEQYNHSDILNFILGCKRKLTETFNPGSKDGMTALLRSSTDAINPSTISTIKSTDAATWVSVLLDAKEEADKLSTTTKPVAPTITERSEATDEADLINRGNQAVIRAKEGFTEAFTEKVGAAITDTVLRSANGTDYKSIDDYEFVELVNAAIQGADRPPTSDILTKLTAIISFVFDFRKKCAANVELLRAKAALLLTYGIVIDDSQLMLIIMANIEEAIRHDYGREFRQTIHDHRREHAYDKKHTATTTNKLLTELAAADAVRRLRDAPAPNHLGTANAVQENYQQSLTRLQQLMNDTADDEASRNSYGTAYSASRRLQYASSGDESSVDTRHSRRTTTRTRDRRDRSPDRRNNRSRSPDRRNNRSPERRNNRSLDRRNNRSPDRRDTDRVTVADTRDNPCRHCAREGRYVVHEGIPEDRCFWNREYKGFRP